MATFGNGEILTIFASHSFIALLWLKRICYGTSVLTYCFPQIAGDNIYAIYRAPKVASTEAIVFSTTLKESQFAVPLMISLCHLISKQTIWAKDVIFLVGFRKTFLYFSGNFVFSGCF